MPLAFETLNHGTVAFGFFNTESDMLLLDRFFFFATEFCELVSELADQKDNGGGLSWKVHLIENVADIGDLMGAIHGLRFSGFIGDVYRRYPFPKHRQDFKQNPLGAATQAEIRALIAPHALETVIRVNPAANGSEIEIGTYRFERAEFQRLLDYVWLGGFPRWRDDLRPDYVEAMRKRVLASTAPLFKGVKFS